MFEDYIKLNKSTGQLTCTDILTASEKDYPESITVTIKGQLISENILLSKIEYKIVKFSACFIPWIQKLDNTYHIFSKHINIISVSGYVIV